MTIEKPVDIQPKALRLSSVPHPRERTGGEGYTRNKLRTYADTMIVAAVRRHYRWEVEEVDVASPPVVFNRISEATLEKMLAECCSKKRGDLF